MLLLINSVRTAIDTNKDLALLKRDIDLSFLNNLFVFGLPKLTLSQNLFEKRNRFIKRFNPTYPSTKHVIYKERIADILGGNIYHAVKVKGCIKDKLENLSNTDLSAKALK
ncbi:hypothetical protein [Candidatus Rhabdochlamydia porcellionis]|jgi:hypothetical protein|uniref:Uncharacterized protein n=1 Tax=Candidatus Rhabdochlamydia porcellionis TaxID=225148 RepID=A0ABX8YYL3_9BACT|nr:hypothetical protein [Candidatus Rhabdochlamydia porcellionis]QZA58416.1 hypothetical protein RHAB15C_0000289 [Candidatus Rhabdochlamydia porcellionis]